MSAKTLCPICFDDLDMALRDGEKRPVCAIGCGHVFHNACITRWLEGRQPGTCPQCMTRLTDRHLQRVLVEVDGDNGAPGRGASGDQGSGAAAAQDGPIDENHAAVRPWKTRVLTLERRTKDLEDENQTLRLLLEEAEQSRNRRTTGSAGADAALSPSGAAAASSLSDRSRASAALGGRVSALLSRHSRPSNVSGEGTGFFGTMDPWEHMEDTGRYDAGIHLGRTRNQSNNAGASASSGLFNENWMNDLWPETPAGRRGASNDTNVAVGDGELDDLLAERRGPTTPNPFWFGRPEDMFMHSSPIQRAMTPGRRGGPSSPMDDSFDWGREIERNMGFGQRSYYGADPFADFRTPRNSGNFANAPRTGNVLPPIGRPCNRCRSGPRTRGVPSLHGGAAPQRSNSSEQHQETNSMRQ